MFAERAEGAIDLDEKRKSLFWYLDPTQEGTLFNKIFHLASDVILMLLFLGFAAIKSQILALAFLSAFTAPAFFIALGVLELISVITVFRKIVKFVREGMFMTTYFEENNSYIKRIFSTHCLALLLPALAPMIIATACFLIVFQVYLHFALSPIVVPALFAGAFVCGIVSASKEIYATFTEKKSFWADALISLIFIGNVIGLAATILTLLLPVIPAVGFSMPAFWVAFLLITTGAFRFMPIMKVCSVSEDFSGFSGDDYTVREGNSADMTNERVNVFSSFDDLKPSKGCTLNPVTGPSGSGGGYMSFASIKSVVTKKSPGRNVYVIEGTQNSDDVGSEIGSEIESESAAAQLPRL